jgi:hypothetical protein
MTRLRRMVVTLGLLGLVGAHIYELALDSEHWPFCSYPMYSRLEDDPTVESQRLVGLHAETGEEIWLHGRQYIDPFDRSRLAEAFELIGSGDDAQARWDRALQDLLQRYEERRLAGLHDGPKLRGMRVYHTRHALHPEAKNRAHPEYRQLRGEAHVR